eukprot:jgi/Mesen1/6685/ME000343S05850
MSRGSAASRTIYVGNLPGDTREREVEDLFRKFGRVLDIDLKLPPRPPGYAFVEFEDARDAEDAIKYRDGYEFDSHKLRVELAHGGRGTSSSGLSSDRNSSFVSGRLSANWRLPFLQDHMRKAGDVCFAQVFRDGNGTMGIVDYTNEDDMKYAIKKLDDTEFRNPFSRGYIRRSPSKSASPAARSPERDRETSPVENGDV